MSSNKVVFNNTVLRDGHQSLAATRMKTEQMLPVAAQLDGMGFGALETWGGATIDCCLRFLNENPFDRLRALKKAAPKTPHMMLLRGQNIVQYTSFPDDVVQAFVKCSAKAGIDIFRVFDALNDIRNIKTAVEAVRAAGKHAQGTICYTTSPVHTVDGLFQIGLELEAMGCNSIVVKDMAGLIPPGIAAELIGRLKKHVKVPVALHTHSTTGLGAATYLAATDAGVDSLDVSIAPFANGTGQPDTVLMLEVLKGNPRCPSYDMQILNDLHRYFEGIYRELKEFTSPTNERVDADCLNYQVPGGMLSNFRNQLKEQGMGERFDEVVQEVPKVREALGWIPLVTPTSQIVGTQAMLNVKFGRWEMLAQPTIDIALGKYGRTPAPVFKEVLKLAEKQSGQSAITCRPADLLQPGMNKLRDECKSKGLSTDDETVVLFAMFPQQLEQYYKGAKEKPREAPNAVPQQAAPRQPAAAPAQKQAVVSATAKQYTLHINGKKWDVAVEELK